MQRCAFTPYEGKKPYIFVSYAHKDSKWVYPVLEELNRRGYRVWYDDGIAPGSEWPENIAQHLSDCALTLAFISPNSIASDNCRREVTFALSKRKCFLGIILEPTTMSPGMEMQLSAQQCIMKYTYPSDAEFYKKVCSCPDLVPCLEEPKPIPAAPAPAVPAAPVAPAPVVTERPAPQMQKEAKPLDKKMLGIIAAGVAVVLIVGVVLAVVLGGGNKPDDSLGGSTPSGNSTPSQSQGDPTGNSDPSDPSDPNDDNQETSLEYYNDSISAEDVAFINKQKNLEYLVMENCVILPGAFDHLDLPESLLEVKFVNCPGIDNLHSLADLSQLEILYIIGCDLRDRMVPELNAPQLLEVNISNNPNFTLLSIFSKCENLEQLRFANTAISNIVPVANFENLFIIDGSNSKVTFVDPICTLENLVEVYFANCGIRAIETPLYCLRLDKLDLSGNELEDTDFLEYCTVLTDVNLSYNELLSTSQLRKSAEALSWLDLSGNNQLYSSDVQFVKNCPNLTTLYMDGLWLFNLDFLSGCNSLRRVSANDCALDNIEGLRELDGLEFVSLAMNSISDLSPLDDKEFLNVLDLSFSRVNMDLSNLTRGTYDILNLTNNQINFDQLDGISGTSLIFSYQEGMLKHSYLKNKPFEEYIVVDCPTDKIVATENTLGKDETLFVKNMEEYFAVMQAAEMPYLFLVRYIE